MIIKQGSEGDGFFVLTKGKAKVIAAHTYHNTHTHTHTHTHTPSIYINAYNAILHTNTCTINTCIVLYGFQVIRVQNDEEKELDVIYEGDYFGEAALITKQVRSASVVACGDCEVTPKIFSHLLLSFLNARTHIYPPRPSFADAVPQLHILQQALLARWSAEERDVC